MLLLAHDVNLLLEIVQASYHVFYSFQQPSSSLGEQGNSVWKALFPAKYLKIFL